MSGVVASGHSRVGRNDNRKVSSVPFGNLVQQALTESFRHTSLVHVRYGDYESFPRHLNDQLVWIVLVHGTDHIHFLGLP